MNSSRINKPHLKTSTFGFDLVGKTIRSSGNKKYKYINLKSKVIGGKLILIKYLNSVKCFNFSTVVNNVENCI